MNTQNLKEKREIEDIKKALRFHSKKMSLQTEKTNQISDEVSVLAQKVVSLEEGGGGGNENLSQVAVTGNYADLEGRPDEAFEMASSFRAYHYQIWGLNKSAGRTKNYYFTCAVDSVIEGSMTVYYRASRRATSIEEKVQMIFNDEPLAETDITILNASTTILTFDFKIRPKKAVNSFAACVTKTGSWSGEPIVMNFSVNITYGKNIFFLNRPLEWHATVYKDKYLLSKSVYPNSVYFIKDKDDFDLTTSTDSVDTKVGKQFILTYTPTYSSNSDFMEMSYSKILAIGLNSDGDYPLISCFTTTGTREMISPEVVDAYSITYFKEHGVDSNPAVAVVIGEDKRLAYWEKVSNTNIIEDYTLNGIPVEKGMWLDNVAVIKQDMTDVFAKTFMGSVAMKNTGECFFFPHYNSDYFVYLGIGRRVNVYLQDNQNINVYMGRENHVIKKVLVKNSETNKYEIDKSQELKINGYDEVFETLDGYFIGVSDSEPELVNWTEVL